MVQLSYLYMTTGTTIVLTLQTFASKVMSLPFNMLSGFVIAFLPRSKNLLISWLLSPFKVTETEPQKDTSWRLGVVSLAGHTPITWPGLCSCLAAQTLYFASLSHVAFQCTSQVELPSCCFSVPPCLSRQRQWTSLSINQFFQPLSGTGKPKQHIPSAAFSHPICKAQLSPLSSGRNQDDLSTSATVIRSKPTYILRFGYKLESSGGGVEVCSFYIIKTTYMWTSLTTSSPDCFLPNPPIHRTLAVNYSQ